VPVLLERLLELLIRDQALLDEDLPELLRLLLHRRHAKFTDGRRRNSSRCFFVMGPRLLKEAGELLGQEAPVDLALSPAGLFVGRGTRTEDRGAAGSRLRFLLRLVLRVRLRCG